MNPVRIKVCGLTDAGNALACARLGADWIGLNFHPPSPRSIPIGRGAEIASALAGRAVAVGLFVDRPHDELIRAVDALGIDHVQFHGDEDVAYLRRCADLRPGLKVVRAFRLADAASVARMVDFLREAEDRGCAPHAVLVDAHVPGIPGGTGRSIAASLLARLPAHPRLVLAGGLDPGNVADRVRRARPWMVDVAGGVESAPGVKDPSRVAAFVAAARGILVNGD